MISKILLVNPWNGEVFPPPSLGYLQATIKTIPGVTVVARDLDAALADRDQYDMIAVSFHSFSVKHARMIRERWPDTFMICGGHHPSALPEQMLKIGFDQVVIGEGENAIKAIINFTTNQKIIRGEICDINSIPFPDYTGFGGNYSMGLPVISSRGCPFDCTFCASTHFWNRQWRMRSAENVLDEIYHLPTKSFMFEDDNFTNNRIRVHEICKGLEGKNYSWQCATRAETLINDDLCLDLRRAGCHTVWLGVESLSQPSLDRNRKNTTVARMLRGIQTAENHGLITMSQFIVGLPGDTQSDIDETVRMIKMSRIRRRGCNTLWILPKTEIHEKALQHGFDDEIYLTHGAPFYTYEQSIETLNQWTHQIIHA